MTARTFGRKGTGDGGAVASRRAAFLAEERARADRTAQSEVFPPPVRPAFAGAGDPGAADGAEGGAPVLRPAAAPAASGFAGERSLTRAYVLWLVLGIVGGHRFYLGRPITGGLQAILFVAAFAMAVSEYYVASAGLMLSALWMVADGFLIKSMHRQANERIAAFA